MTEQRPIDTIRVDDRHRKNMGNLDGLASSIAMLGLLQPITVDPDGQLISGGRRLLACRQLGWTAIPVYVVTNLNEARDRLMAERAENTERKAMTPSELVTLAADIEAIEAPEAKKRMAEGGRGGIGRGASVGTPSPRGKTREIVAAAVGMGRTNLGYAKKIIARAEQGDERAIEAKRRMDETGQVMPNYEYMIGRRVSHKERDEPTPGLKSRAQRAELIAELAEQGYTSRQMSSLVGVADQRVRHIAREFDIKIPADRSVGKSRRIDSNRIVVQTATALEGLVMGLELIDYTALDPQEVGQWTASLTHSLRALNRDIKKIKETVQ